MKPNILLLTHSKDFFTIDKVEYWVKQLGGIPIRFNTDLYPANVAISNSFNYTEDKTNVVIKNETFYLDDIEAVWVRRIWQPLMPEGLSPESKQICVTESKTNIYNCLELYSHIRWMDPLNRIKEAQNKLKQLKLAKELKINIPQTIISNHKEDILNFFYANNTKVVTKLQHAISTSMSGNAPSFKTVRVLEKDLIENEGMHLCPMIFQEEIDKIEEYRIIYVNGSFFIGGIKPIQSGEYLVDIKNTTKKNAQWFKADIPSTVKEKLHLLMKKFEITFGAIDMVKSANNEYIFLEVNPVGEWGMIEKELDMPIAKRIAHYLMDKN